MDEVTEPFLAYSQQA